MKRTLAIICVILTAVCLLSACGSSTTKTRDPEEITVNDLLQFSAVKSGETLARLETDMGDIVVRFFPEKAPKAVENFVTLARDGAYDGILFHRIMDNFMIQSGNTGTGKSIWGGTFEDEFSNQLYNFRGALSMANAGPRTNSTQFFIVQSSDADGANGYPPVVLDKYRELGGTPWLDNLHTVFGHVVEGMDVVDAIAATPAIDRNGTPSKEVWLKHVEVYEAP